MSCRVRGTTATVWMRYRQYKNLVVMRQRHNLRYGEWRQCMLSTARKRFQRCIGDGVNNTGGKRRRNWLIAVHPQRH